MAGSTHGNLRAPAIARALHFINVLTCALFRRVLTMVLRSIVEAPKHAAWNQLGPFSSISLFRWLAVLSFRKRSPTSYRYIP